MDARSRTWAFILYEESAPSDWMDILADLHIPAAISPLHDKDVWSERDEAECPEHRAGEAKKPHWHVVLYFGAKKSAKQVISALEPLGVRYVERVRETVAYNRYLCHLDSEDKARYPVEGIRRLSGATCELERPMSATERHEAMTAITQFVRDYGISEYSELVYWCMDNMPEWTPVVMTQTVYFRGLLASVRAVAVREGEASHGR